MAFYVTPALALCSLTGALVAALSSEFKLAVIAGLVFVSLSMYSLWGYREEDKRHVRIVLKTRSDAPNFAVRNRDQIAMNLGFMVIGGLLTKLLGI